MTHPLPNGPSGSSESPTPAVCFGCACLCDDLLINLEGAGHELDIIQNASCEVGEAYFRAALQPNPMPRYVPEPLRCHVQGKSVENADAIESAADCLAQAIRPMVCGFDGLDVEANRAAVAVADRIGAVLCSAEPLDATVIRGVQRVGMVGATLGEIRNRADLVIFWGTDPMTTHPRHLQRYSLTSHVPHRHAIVLDTHLTPTARHVSQFMQVPQQANADAIAAIRMLVQDMPVDTVRLEESTGQPAAAWHDLVRRMKSCRYGAVFFGAGIAGDLAATQGLLRLVRELNQSTRFVCLHNRKSAFGLTSENVMAWQTGYPTAVDLSAGYPRYNPLHGNAETILSAGGIDAVLCVGDVARSVAAQTRLAQIPRITISAQADVDADVGLLVARPGIHHAATLDRMDNVPITAPPLIDSPLPSAAAILRALERTVQKKNAPNSVGGWRVESV